MYEHYFTIEEVESGIQYYRIKHPCCSIVFEGKIFDSCVVACPTSVAEFLEKFSASKEPIHPLYLLEIFDASSIITFEGFYDHFTKMMRIFRNNLTKDPGYYDEYEYQNYKFVGVPAINGIPSLLEKHRKIHLESRIQQFSRK